MTCAQDKALGIRQIAADPRRLADASVPVKFPCWADFGEWPA